MTEPRRWLDDPEASAPLKQALGSARPTRSLDRATRHRVGARLGRLGMVPLSAVTWLSVKSAAALGLAGGATVAGTMIAVERHRASHDVVITAAPATPAPTRAARTSKIAGHRSAFAEEASEPFVPQATPTLNPPAELPRAERPHAPAPSAAASGGLAEESALLEQARRALARAPGAALSSVREHARLFPHGQLAAERSLIEVDALFRMGRRAEARALAERLLAQGGGDLYVGRVERLLQQIDGGQ